MWDAVDACHARREMFTRAVPMGQLHGSTCVILAQTLQGLIMAFINAATSGSRITWAR